MRNKYTTVRRLKLKREDGKHYFQCKKCALVMVRTYKNRRHDTIELTIPKGIDRVSR